MKFAPRIRLTVLAALLSGGIGAAQAQISAPTPQVQTIGPNDLFQDVVNGAPGPINQYVSAGNLAGFVGNASPGTSPNFLIGGKADQNLWQRGTTGSSVTTTVAYGGPDRWAYWSGTSTAMTLSKASTAAALPAGSANVFRMQRTSGQTGVVQVCAMQELTSNNTYYLQGHTVEFDANVYTGANFSPTAGMTVYISYGTSTDEGVSKMAFSLNAGGGGSAATGFANATAAVIPLAAVSTAYRVAAVAQIPTTATEMAVSICYTPVGTAGTTDALYFDNAELRKADGLAPFVNTAAGYVLAGNVLTTTINGVAQYAYIPAFSIRPYEQETTLQYAYAYSVAEPATAVGVGFSGNAVTTTTCNTSLAFPVTMRVAPTFTAYGTALSASTWKINYAATSTTLATTFYVTTTGNTPSAAFGTWTVSSAALVAGGSCFPVGAAGGSTLLWSAEL